MLLVVGALGLVMMGALGLAIDSGQLYGHRQMAQTAADAAAQSAALSIYGGTNTGGNAFGDSSFTCTNGTDARTPCAYARLNSFGTTGSTDTVDVDFPTTVSGVTLSAAFNPAAVHVLITRPVKVSFLRMLGAAATTSIKAAGTAAITDIPVAVPILILHPTLSGSFALGGNSSIQVCGGPSQSIQVNSSSATAVSVSGSVHVDLSHAGPADTAGNCTSGTGGDFGVFGGPRTPNPPSWLTPLGSKEDYYSPNPPIQDPYKNVPYPSDPGAPPFAPVNGVALGTGSCPATLPNGDTPGKPCTIYWPGTYPGGIDIKNQTAVFNPGIYYISGGGFTSGANGDAVMCATGCTADTSGCCSEGGMLVYLTASGGKAEIGANGAVFLKGSDQGSTYKGLLFFGNRSMPATTHKFGGGGAMTLEGTIYLTNTTMTSTTFQTVLLRGSSGSSTLIKGQIIVSAIDLGGTGDIIMQLNPDLLLTVPQVALVN
jgi:hypothetical protein